MFAHSSITNMQPIEQTAYGYGTSVSVVFLTLAVAHCAIALVVWLAAALTGQPSEQ